MSSYRLFQDHRETQLRLFLNRACFSGARAGGKSSASRLQPAPSAAGPGPTLRFRIHRTARDVGVTQPLPCSTSAEGERRARREDTPEGAERTRRGMFSGRCAHSMHTRLPWYPRPRNRAVCRLRWACRRIGEHTGSSRRRAAWPPGFRSARPLIPAFRNVRRRARSSLGPERHGRVWPPCVLRSSAPAGR